MQRSACAGSAAKSRPFSATIAREVCNRATCSNTDGEIAGIVMLNLDQTRGGKNDVDLRWQISNFLVSETSRGNHAQAQFIGRAQHGSKFVG